MLDKHLWDVLFADAEMQGEATIEVARKVASMQADSTGAMTRRGPVWCERRSSRGWRRGSPESRSEGREIFKREGRREAGRRSTKLLQGARR